jgi:hypothetical protein
VRLEAELIEALKLKVRPLNRSDARDREPDRDLNSELFSARLEDENRTPIRDLKKEVFSARLEAEEKEPVKDLARPLT